MERKRYGLFHRILQVYREAIAHSFQEACEQLGWLTDETAVWSIRREDDKDEWNNSQTETTGR